MKLSNLLKPSKYQGYLDFFLFSVKKLYKNANLTFSQTGEDLLIKSASRFLEITDPTYLDIGANHPIYLSNTFLFYLAGSRGVCIEPNPSLASFFQKKRPRDTVLQIAIAPTNGITTLHIVSDNALSTTAKTQAAHFKQSSKHSVVQEIKVPAKTMADIIDEYFPAKDPDIISLDIEGMDLQVLESFDFHRSRPPIFCVETLTYDEAKNGKKITQIIDLMVSRDYFVFADTFLNTIFVDKRCWDKKK